MELRHQKRGLFQASTPFLRGRQGLIRQITSLELTRKFWTASFNFLLLGEAEIEISLGIKFWFGDVALFVVYVSCSPQGNPHLNSLGLPHL